MSETSDYPNRTKTGGLDAMDKENDGCSFALRVERDDELTHVPVDNVRHSVYAEVIGEVPERVDYTRVYITKSAKIAAEAWDNGEITVMVETEPNSGEFRARHISRPSGIETGAAELWRVPGKEKRELGTLVELGLSPAEALDYWSVDMKGETATRWAEKRGVSHQAVSENVRKASDALGVDND